MNLEELLKRIPDIKDEVKNKEPEATDDKVKDSTKADRKKGMKPVYTDVSVGNPS